MFSIFFLQEVNIVGQEFIELINVGLFLHLAHLLFYYMEMG